MYCVFIQFLGMTLHPKFSDKFLVPDTDHQKLIFKFCTSDKALALSDAIIAIPTDSCSPKIEVATANDITDHQNLTQFLFLR